MKLSTKGRYGIQAMYDLACCDPSTPQSIKAVAERQGIPEAYLEQLIASLRRSGLVRSIRGAQGGYLLSRRPDEITVGQVLRALEGELAVADCLLDSSICSRACSCPTHLVWQKISDGVNQIVDSITLQDMKNDQEHLHAQEGERTL